MKRPILPILAAAVALVLLGLGMRSHSGADAPEAPQAPSTQASTPRPAAKPAAKPAQAGDGGWAAQQAGEPAEEDAPEGAAGDAEAGPEPAAGADDAPLCAQAASMPDQEALGFDDPSYDARTEARQIFAPFEDALRARRPLDANRFKAALSEHKDRNIKVLKRAEFLRQSGQPDAAADLMEEWSRLYAIYQAEAYGRPSPE